MKLAIVVLIIIIIIIIITIILINFQIQIHTIFIKKVVVVVELFPGVAKIVLIVAGVKINKN